jgi:Cof subfamily protein (haloacid dehalogenase superfamily)
VIPLVILDLDGTVIGSSGQVLPGVWDALDRAREAGVKLALCTGRPGLGIALRVARRIGPTNPHVFQSGAHIAFTDGETLKASALKEASTKRLVQHARSLGLVLEVYTPNHLYVERKTPMSEAHAKTLGVTAIVRDLGEVAETEPVVRAQWVLTPAQESAAMALTLDGVQVSRATSPALPDTLFVGLTRAGVSKGTAVSDLVAHMKLRVDQVMAVGDGAGDLPMLSLVGHPVVMENAESALKDRFSVVVGHVDDGGVVEALERAIGGARA